jgi:hypothetical protein
MLKNKDLKDGDINNIVENEILHAEFRERVGQSVPNKSEFAVQEGLNFVRKSSLEDLARLPNLIRHKKNVIAKIDQSRGK